MAQPTYDINAINKLALQVGVKPLTPQQIQTMKPAEVKAYLKAGAKAGKYTAKIARQLGRQLRRNAKLTTSESFKQAQLMHGTIRQAVGELGALGAQGLAQSAISRKTSPVSAIEQNTDGGTVQQGTDTEKGPVYAYKGREEE